MSHHRNIAVLAHHQPVGSHAGTYVPRAVAAELVRRMVVERISARVIRMLPPSSVFLAAMQAVLPLVKYIPARLPSAEIENCYFSPPRSDPAPRLSTVRSEWDWSMDPEFLP